MIRLLISTAPIVLGRNARARSARGHGARTRSALASVGFLASWFVACGSGADAPPSSAAGASALGGNAGASTAGASATGGTSGSATGGTATGGTATGGTATSGASGSATGGAAGRANGGASGMTQSAGRNGGGRGGRGNDMAGAAGDEAASGRGGRAAGSGGSAGSAAGSGSSGNAGGPAGWTLSWSDEFDGPSGQSPDSTKWAYDTGGDGWGNNELEYYTNRPENSATDGDGHLVITLKSETYMNRMYTSARLKTLGKFTQAYGRFEARLKVPRGQGVWPAFWMLGEDIATNVWPNCGEIDIMEVAGRDPTVNHGSLHGPGYSGGSPLTGTTKLPSGTLSDDFHVYAIEWETNVVRWYLDSNNYQTKRNTDVPSGSDWVYDHPFFVIMNVAMGGAFGGDPDGSATLPQTLTADYVRVYTKD